MGGTGALTRARRGRRALWWRREESGAMVWIAMSESELVFVVEEAPEGGFTARCLNAPIFTEADTLEAVPAQVRDAVRCHFEEDERPSVIRLHYIREEIIAA